ncbi:MAG: hypothetical protein K6G50_00855 [bacterium]|nr:hypothetical protein [bacterium]
MKIRNIFADPILIREMTAASREPGSNMRSYPGPKIMLACVLVPFALHIISFGGRSLEESLGINCWTLSAWLQTVAAMLIASRTAAFSMEEDVRQDSMSVLVSSSRGCFRAILAKLAAIMVPVWLDLAAGSVFLIIVYGLFGSIPVPVMAACALMQMAAALLAGAYGILAGETGLKSPSAAAFDIAALCLGGQILSSDLFNNEPLAVSCIMAGFVLIWIVPRFFPKMSVLVSVLVLAGIAAFPLVPKHSCQWMALANLTPLRACVSVTSELNIPDQIYFNHLYEGFSADEAADSIIFESEEKREQCRVTLSNLQVISFRIIWLFATALFYVFLTVMVFYLSVFKARQAVLDAFGRDEVPGA